MMNNLITSEMIGTFYLEFLNLNTTGKQHEDLKAEVESKLQLVI